MGSHARRITLCVLQVVPTKTKQPQLIWPKILTHRTRKMKMIEYIIKIIEPEAEYMYTATQSTLELCKAEAQYTLNRCPPGTKHIYVATKVIQSRITL